MTMHWHSDNTRWLDVRFRKVEVAARAAMGYRLWRAVWVDAENGTGVILVPHAAYYAALHADEDRRPRG